MMMDSAAVEPEFDTNYLNAEIAKVAEMRRIAFAIEDALDKTPNGVSLKRPIALFVKRVLFDIADTIELEQ